MVIIASDLNKELDKYISSRRESASWSLFSPRKPKAKHAEELPEGLSSDKVHIITEEPLPMKGGPNLSEDLSPEEMARLEAMQRDLERVDRAEEAHPAFQEELEEERESLLDRFFAFFRLSDRRHRLERKAHELEYVEEEVVPRIDEDVKRVLKIVHSWLEQLPSKEKKAFKKSKDFQEYKALLQKYGIAK